MKKNSWLTGPLAFFALAVVLLAVWLLLDPVTLTENFDRDGRSIVELSTIAAFALIVPVVWWECPFSGSRKRQIILCLATSIVAIMAIVKELDLHLTLLHWLYPDFVTADGSMAPGLFKPNGNPLTGTPFKARVLTNAGVPLMMKVWIIGYFIAFFGVFAAGFAYLLPCWIKGVLKLDAASWAWGCFGGSGIIVQISDRLPSWLGHNYGLDKSTDAITKVSSLCTCLEEGGEMMIAVFALLTIFLSHKRNKEQ